MRRRERATTCAGPEGRPKGVGKSVERVSEGFGRGIRRHQKAIRWQAHLGCAGRLGLQKGEEQRRLEHREHRARACVHDGAVGGGAVSGVVRRPRRRAVSGGGGLEARCLCAEVLEREARVARHAREHAQAEQLCVEWAAGENELRRMRETRGDQGRSWEVTRDHLHVGVLRRGGRCEEVVHAARNVEGEVHRVPGAQYQPRCEQGGGSRAGDEVVRRHWKTLEAIGGHRKASEDIKRRSGGARNAIGSHRKGSEPIARLREGGSRRQQVRRSRGASLRSRGGPRRRGRRRSRRPSACMRMCSARCGA